LKVTAINAMESLGGVKVFTRVAAVALILWTAHSAAIAATWGTPGTIESDTAGSVSFPTVAVDANGNAIAVWTEMDFESGVRRFNLWANRYTVANGWGTAEKIESQGNDAVDFTLAMDANGNAAVGWAQSDGASLYKDAWVRNYSPGAGWGAVTKLLNVNTDGDAQSMDVAFDSAGNALIAWTQESLPFGSQGYTQDIWVSRYVPNVGWSAAQKINGTTSPSSDPNVGIDASGSATVVWKAEKPGTPGAIWTNRFTPTSGTSTGTWGTAQTLSTGTDGQLPVVAVNAGGSAVVTWYATTGFSVLAARYTVGQGWSSEETVYHAAQGSFEIPAFPQVAIDVSGNAITVWQNFANGLIDIRASRYVPGQGWNSAPILDANNFDAGYPHIAMDSGGNAVAVWHQPGVANGVSKIWSNRYLVGTGWQGAESIETGLSEAAITPVVSANPTGTVFAVWAQGPSIVRNDVWSASSMTTTANSGGTSNPGTGGGTTGGTGNAGSTPAAGGGGGGVLGAPALIVLLLAALGRGINGAGTHSARFRLSSPR
jgi:hypothetical protein